MLRNNSRQVAKRQYEEGPGASATNLDHLDDSHQLQKKRKKIVSAYVSRFSAKAYDDILPQAVADSVKELDCIRQRRDTILQENEVLAAEIDRLQRLRNSGRSVVKCEEYEAPSGDLRASSERPYSSWTGHVDVPFSPKSEETVVFRSRAVVFEPVTPNSGPPLQGHSPVVGFLNSDSTPAEFCSDYGEAESIVSDDFIPLKGGANLSWQGVSGSSEWVQSLPELMANDSFSLTD